MKEDIKNRLVNMAIAVGSVLLVLILFEVALYATAPDYPSRIFCEGVEDKGGFHPVFGWTERPNSQYLEKWSAEDDWSLVTINEEGFRDTFDSGQDNIIVLGDSHTRGTLADDNSTYPFLLDRWSPNTSFINYGMGDYGNDQELLVYRKKAKEIEHNLTILGYYMGNDPANNMDRHPPRPQFEVKGGELVQTHEPQKPPLTRGEGFFSGLSSIITDPGLSKIKLFFLHHIYLAEAVHPAINRIQRSLEEEKTQKTEGNLRNRSLKLTSLLLERVSSVASNNSADLLIVLIPTHTEIKRINFSSSGYDPPVMPSWKAQREMISDLERNISNLEVLDLKPVLRREFEKGNRLYGKIDAHTDDYGYRVAAKAIYNRLVKEGYLSNNTDANLSREYSKDIVECPS